MDERRERQAQDLAVTACERARAWVVGRPLAHHAFDRGWRTGGRFGVHRVELSVLRELGMERDEAETAPKSASGEEARAHAALDVEINRRHGVSQEVQPAVEIRHIFAAR